MFTGKATSLSRVSTAKHFSAGGRFIFCQEEIQIKPRVLSEEKWELNWGIGGEDDKDLADIFSFWWVAFGDQGDDKDLADTFGLCFVTFR